MVKSGRARSRAQPPSQEENVPDKVDPSRGPGAGADVFLDTAFDQLARARVANREAILRAARMIADTVGTEGIVYLFGSGHSALLALEAAGRAGGFAGVQPIWDPGIGRAEQVEGYGSVLVREVNWEPRDCLFVISHSGRNPAPIEVALAGKAAGLRVAGITAVDYSRASVSRHSSGKRLFEVVDFVIDTLGVPGDAAVEVEGLAVRTGPTSTIVGATLLDAAIVEAVSLLVAAGVEPPLVRSYNLEGSDPVNARARARYRGRVVKVI
jgi:uncharacterized phosphosugar-binding protein